MNERQISIFTIFAVLVVTIHAAVEEWHLTNLNTQCMKCLCHAATGCDITLRCTAGFCGPYKVSKIYWKEAGNVTLEDDDPERAGAFEDCAHHYWCAQRIVKQYLKLFGKDCNGDGVTDCYDYMMINFNGGYGCNQPLDRDQWGRAWIERYNKCQAEKL